MALKLTEEEYLAKYEEFLIDITDTDFERVPTKANFAKFIGVSQKDVIYWYKQHPACKDVIDQMTADTLLEGMLLKKYTERAGSLALKNLCKWQDNPEKTKVIQPTQNALLDEKEAQKRVDEYSNNFEARRKALRVAK